MNNFLSNLLIKKRDTIFFLSLSVVSFSALMLIILLFINAPDTITLKWPVTLSLLPIYLIVRFIFLKIESNIKINKTEEIVKLLLFVYFLIFISTKFFPLNKGFDPGFLSISFLSFNTLSSIKFIIKTCITYLILFIPLGFLAPMIIAKFRNISNCAILSIILSITISVLEISLHSIGLYFVDIISLDLLLINVIGTLIGYKIYYFMVNYNLNRSKSFL